MLMEKDNKNPFILAIYEHSLKNKYISLIFDEFKEKKKKKEENLFPIGFNDFITKKKIFTFYSGIISKNDLMSFSIDKSFKDKLCEHIEQNISFSERENNCTSYICSVIGIFKNLQRKNIKEYFLKDNKDDLFGLNGGNIFLEFCSRIQNLMFQMERKSQIEIEKIQKSIIGYSKFEKLLKKNINLLSFKSWPGLNGLFGKEISKIVINDIYLPGYSLLEKIFERFQINEYIEDKSIDEIEVKMFNNFLFLSSDDNNRNNKEQIYINSSNYPITNFNSFIEKIEKLPLINLIVYILLIFNLCDGKEQPKKDRFDYIYSFYNKNLNTKINHLKLLKDLFCLIDKTIDYNKSFFNEKIAEYNDYFKKKYASQNIENCENLYTKFLEISKFLKPSFTYEILNDSTDFEKLILMKKNNLSKYIKDPEIFLNIVIYESDLDLVLEKIRQNYILSKKINIYLLPEKDNYMKNKITLKIAKNDELYKNLIFKTFTSLSSIEANNYSIASIKGNFQLYLNEANNYFPIYLYKLKTSNYEMIIDTEFIIITSTNYPRFNLDILAFKIFIYDKHNNIIYNKDTNFDNILINTKNIFSRDDSPLENSFIYNRENDLCIKIIPTDESKNIFFSANKIVIRSKKEQSKIIITGYGDLEPVSELILEGCYDSNGENAFIPIKTFEKF